MTRSKALHEHLNTSFAHRTRLKTLIVVEFWKSPSLEAINAHLHINRDELTRVQSHILQLYTYFSMYQHLDIRGYFCNYEKPLNSGNVMDTPLKEADSGTKTRHNNRKHINNVSVQWEANFSASPRLSFPLICGNSD